MAKSKDSKYRMDDNSDKNSDRSWGWNKTEPYKREKKDWANTPTDDTDESEAKP